MARRSKAPSTPADAIEKLKSLLDNFLAEVNQPDLRRKVRSLIPAVHVLRGLGSSLIDKADAASGRDRIIHYLKAYLRTLVDGDELLVVSGIGEWARRVRELRVQYGWWIYSGATIKQMTTDDAQIEALRSMLGSDPKKVKPNQYILVREEEDRDAAHRWNLSNSIRRKKISVQDKILEYMRANVGKQITGEELRYLAADRIEWPRRARELRTDEGWPVYTKMQGRPDLPVGVYVLEEDKQAPPHDRKIPDAVRVDVLERDGHKCTVCGWHREMLAQGDPRKFLEAHHIEEHAKGGSNEVANLKTLCNVHHDEVHAGKLAWKGAQWVKVP